MIRKYPRDGLSYGSGLPDLGRAQQTTAAACWRCDSTAGCDADTGAVHLNDLHAFDPATMAWTNLSAAAGTPPTPRFVHGFACAAGKLYVHGGYDVSGVSEEGKVGSWGGGGWRRRVIGAGRQVLLEYSGCTVTDGTMVQVDDSHPVVG
jgi:hypothetical protein